jgi:3',5'-cyclic AMP phosphodiesterase CpdA
LLLLAALTSGFARAETFPAFGVVADIQYGDKEGSVSRDYRGSLKRLEQCIEAFNRQRLDFVIQLGDAIDGYPTNAAASCADLDRVLSVFNRLTAPKYHVIGNHCMNAGTNALAQRLGLATFFYTFTAPAAKGWRFVVLDGNDAGYGVVSDRQLAWFRDTLDQAQAAGEKVICFCHFPLLKTAAKHHRMAKPEEILQTLHAHTCVAAWIAGHEHAGGYARQRHVHHLTLRGLVEAPGSTAFARFELAGDRILETGYGNEPSRELFLGGASAPQP